MKNTFNKTKAPAIAAVFGACMVLSPAAHAENTVGKVIAAQGNIALQIIKAEIKQQIEAWTPSLEALPKPKPDTTVKTRQQTADGMVAAGTAHCAP